MTNLQRITGKVFGETASPVGDEDLGAYIGQFGSAKLGTYYGTADVAEIQNLTAWSNGFIDAVTPTNQYPTLPEMTGVCKNLSHQECYILQHGVPEYDANTVYYTDCFCSYNGDIYKSIADNNTGNQPDISDTYWVNYLAGIQCAPFSVNTGNTSNGKNNTLTNSGAVITCAPCTITTADSRTKVFGTSATLDVSTMANGRYNIFKNFSTGELLADKSLSVFKSIPPNCSGWGVVSLNNGVLSNFSTNNYCVLPQNFNVSGGKTFKISFEVTTGNDVATQQYFLGGANISVSSDPVILGIYNNKFVAYIAYSSSGSAVAVTSNVTPVADTTYQIDFEFTGSTYTLSINGTVGATLTSSTSIWTAGLTIGAQAASGGTPTSPWLGSVNLVNSKIEIDGSIWWTGVYKYWLDNSKTPLNLKVFDNGSYIVNNDLVYIGDCTISSGSITDLSNVDFNATREGDWVFGIVTTLNTSTSANTYKMDTSSVIPNDGYNYQLLCRYFVERYGIDNSNTNYYIRTNLRGKDYLSYTTITSEGIDGGSSNNDVTQQGGQFTLVLDGTRNIYLTIAGTNLYDNNIYLIGYRRLATL